MNEPLDPIHIEYAVDRILGDADSFSDWLSGECFNQINVTSDYESRNANARLHQAPSATILCAALRAADKGDDKLCILAMQNLVARFLRSEDARMRLIATESQDEASA